MVSCLLISVKHQPLHVVKRRFLHPQIMNFNSLETHKWVEELKCVVCSNYLSFFPIHTSELVSICGRCSVPAEGYVHNKIYEVVSQEIQFPCRYKNVGCYDKLVPKDMPDHEHQCAYRISECPTQKFSGCNKKISQPDLGNHCQNEHSKLFLENGEFKMDVSKSEKWQNLLEHNNQLFVVMRKYRVKEEVLQFSITRRENGATLAVAPYEVSFTCENKHFSITCQVNAKTTINEISLHSLIGQKNKSPIISGKIYIGTKVPVLANENVNNTLLSLLKCYKCSEHILPPFYFSSSRMKCPNCQSYQSEVSGTNSKWDELANLLTYPCENAKNGCPIISQPQQMEAHQKFCPFGTQTCPVKDYVECNWTGFRKDLHSHVLTDHQELLVSTSSTSEPFSQLQNPKCYILRFSRYVFILIILKQSSRYYWAMQMIGEVQNEFKYEIEVLGGGKKMVASQFCSQFCKKNELLNNLTNCIYFDSDQIQKLLDDQRINFKVRIFKNT